MRETLADPVTGQVMCCACRQLWPSEREAWLCNHTSRVPVVPGYPLPRRVPAPVVAPSAPSPSPWLFLARVLPLFLVLYVLVVIWWTTTATA